MTREELRTKTKAAVEVLENLGVIPRLRLPEKLDKFEHTVGTRLLDRLEELGLPAETHFAVVQKVTTIISLQLLKAGRIGMDDGVMATEAVTKEFMRRIGLEWVPSDTEGMNESVMEDLSALMEEL